MDIFKPSRHSTRFRGYDYTLAVAYSITVCTIHHRPFFGAIEKDAMKLNWVGRIAESEWMRVADIRSEIALNEFVVMPNHFHEIVLITPHGQPTNAPFEQATFGKPQSKSLAMIVGGFKSAVTRAVNQKRATQNQSPVVVWQGRFYDLIIRTEKELNYTRRYILENPQNWRKDEYA